MLPRPEARVPNRCDVLVCGGGLAGLALARQLAREQPLLSVVVVDKLRRPLPVAAFKVGESTVESSAYYLREVLGLEEHLGAQQLKKCGLRYFFGDTAGPHRERPELGLSRFPAKDSYQIDRGLLETALRERVERSALLLEGWNVDSVDLGAGSDAHRIVLGGAEGEKRSMEARWVIDATGRRRLLQRHLGLPRKSAAEVPFHAAWFRVSGRLDVDSFVPSEDLEWRRRTTEGIRYFSTNHLMGRGYWVWLIPLASGFTSVGIVAHGGIHDFATLSTRDRCDAWLAQHEPALARALAGTQSADFIAYKNYSYTSTRVFSHERWACVGEAGVFADPFYSPGMWQIALSNSVAARMIRLDGEGALSQANADAMNDVYLQVNDELTRSIQSTFEYSDQPAVVAAKLLWDFVTGWALTGALVMNEGLIEPDKRPFGLHADPRFWHLSRVMRTLLVQWGARAKGRLAFDFIDYQSIPFMREMYLRVLQPGKDAATLERDHLATMDFLEELAQAIFLLALEDCMPEALADLPSPLWLNARALSLDPAVWERRGLRNPTTAPRDLTRVRSQLGTVFRRPPAREAGA